jgi:murein DD-endopeptidase MepM/ murein hydrolase activator NlpD
MADFSEIISVGDGTFASGVYDGAEEQLTPFTREGKSFQWTKTRRDRSTVWAHWRPTIPTSGLYELEAWIPGQKATTRHARYHIHGVAGTGTTTEAEANQLSISDAYISLGVFDLDAAQENCGMVNMTNLIKQNEAAGKDIAFGPIRWRAVQFIDGFDAPVGTEEQRRSAQVWPGSWADLNSHLTRYQLSRGKWYYHTGADLNLPHNLDAGAPCYAIADGRVILSELARDPYKGWGNIIVIEHSPYRAPNGEQIWAFSRYAHLKQRLVSFGEVVKRGKQIGLVGKTGTLGEHLHFDISINKKLQDNPRHWPKQDNRAEVEENYVNPLDFIQRYRPMSG